MVTISLISGAPQHARPVTCEVGRYHLFRCQGDDAEFRQAGRPGRDDVVAAQQEQLVAGQRLAGDELHQARLQAGQAVRHREHRAAMAGLRHDPCDQVAHRPDLRPAELEG